MRLARPGIGGLLGAVVGVAVVAVFGLPALDTGSEPEADERPHGLLEPLDPGSAVAFVDAWRASLEGTYLAEGRFQRVTSAGRPLDGTTYLAQRPPDRVEVGFGSIDAVLGGRRVACAPDDEGQARCRTADAPPFERRVDDEVGRVRGLVVEDPDTDVVVPYRVARDAAGCFVLTLRFDLPAPPYGRRATFCFDDETGARVATEVERDDGVVDRHRVTRLEPVVTGPDLVAPAPDVLGPHLGE